ncbi:hypothetical protein FRC06_006545, partial [Ceratobasidium sp. 370]
MALSHQSASEELYPEEEDELALDPLANEEDAMEEVDQLADEVEVSEPEDFEITYLVPKGTGQVHKTLVLSPHTTWSVFQIRVANLMGVNRLELSLSYLFSNAKAGSLYRTLETRDEYKSMVKQFGVLLKTPSKRKTSLTIQIKSQIEPEKPKAGTSKKATRKAVSDDESVDGSDDPVWKIVAQLHK